jgi:GNAT superfamily N-acetyltransferase
MPHERLQAFVVIDYTVDMVILAVIKQAEQEEIVGVGQYSLDDETSHMANASFAVRDDYQNQGIGKELLAYLTYLAKKRGILGFTAEVLRENRRMLRVFEKTGFDISKRMEQGVYELKMIFRDEEVKRPDSNEM